MRPITPKRVQIHFQCVCGYNEVDHEMLLIRWEDLARAGIVRKKDKKTGKPFLLQIQKSNECNLH